jgi:hypothetical protein
MTVIGSATPRALLSIAVVVLATCQHVPPRCGFSDFEPRPYDHIIESAGHHDTTTFQGHLVSEDIAGPWPADLDGQFELHGENGFFAIVPVVDGGRFQQQLEPGQYCFKLSADWFRSVLGTISISRSARAKELTFPMIISE